MYKYSVNNLSLFRPISIIINYLSLSRLFHFDLSSILIQIILCFNMFCFYLDFILIQHRCYVDVRAKTLHCQ